MKVNFNCTKEENDLIIKIVERADKMFDVEDKLSLQMDVTATHMNGNRLRLNDLLNADDFNFAHDVGGITGCIDRTNGTLKNGFLPRFSE